MSNALIGPLAAVAALVALAGVIKLKDPLPTTRALRQLGWPATGSLVRALGLLETAAGAATLLGGGRWSGGAAAGCTAALYGAFAVFLVTARRQGGPLTSCGCFGRTDTPVTTTHVVLDVGAGAIAAAGFVVRTSGMAARLAAQPAQAPALLIAVGGVVALGYIAFSISPTLAVERRR